MENMLNGIGGNTPEESEKPVGGEYSEEEGVNTPQYYESQMTPIKWDETANGGAGDWVETDGSDPDWYNYENKEWANAITEDGSYWVWIPRYAYRITNGYHQSGENLNSVSPVEGAGTIEVEFMKGTSNETATGQTIVEYNDSTTSNYTQFPNGYVIHPAFNYGSTVSGIWVAKFEASQSDASSSSMGSSGVIKVKPGVQSWRDITVNDIYTKCLNYISTLNSHMMKNDEWGAVAYLSKSRYGKETEEVWINNSIDYITGSAGSNAVADEGVDTNTDYTSEQGMKASTTGNIYGIYDMNGGAWEYVAAYIDNSTTNYGLSLINGENKTKNVYIKATADNIIDNYNKNKNIYGDAIYETSNNVIDPWNKGWYSDYTAFPENAFPFFIRGGSRSYSSEAGIFCFNRHLGDSSNNFSFRPVLIIL